MAKTHRLCIALFLVMAALVVPVARLRSDAPSQVDLSQLAAAERWEEVGAGSASGGGISDNSGLSWRPSAAVAPNSTIYVAWYDYSGGDSEIYVRRWHGSNWEEVGAGSASGGGISDNAGSSYRASLGIDPDGTPYVAWYDYSGGDPEIYLRRWNGTSWEEVGAGSASGGGISDNAGDSRVPSLAIAPDGTPYVTWHDDSGGDDEIYVRRWVELVCVFLPLLLNSYTPPEELYYDDGERDPSTLGERGRAGGVAAWKGLRPLTIS